jgi:hypothetical protein
LIDVTSKEGFLEFTKDVGAMQARGGYIVAGVNGSGEPIDAMNTCDLRMLDEASLAPKLSKYLPDPIEIRLGIHELDGNTIVLIYVGRHPNGYAIFHTDGQYDKWVAGCGLSLRVRSVGRMRSPGQAPSPSHR